MRKQSTVLMRARDKRKMEEERDAEKLRSRDRDYAAGRIALDRVMPLINDDEEWGGAC